MSSRADIVVVGAGIVGLATALHLVRRFPGLAVTVVEKEAEVATHQTGHNSGVIHSGIYYKPGSLKARLCVEGVAALLRFCAENEIPYDLCGKVIVATEEQERGRLEELYRRGLENGLQGLQMLSGDEIREFEPHAAGICGVRVPGTGIVDYARVARAYAVLISRHGGQVLCNHGVTGLRRTGGLTTLETSQGEITAKLVINCAGLHSDRISRMAGASLDLAIVPFRGEYYDLAPGRQHLVRGLLYPVADPRFPFLGVHFTRRIGGGVEAGPNAVLAFKREGYSKQSFAPADVADYAKFPGFWIMASKHWKMSLGEYHRSWSKAAFVRALQRLLPELAMEDLTPGGSGVRAQALGRDGKLIDDFHFLYTDGMMHVCNVPSPAATASLAIGNYIVETILRRAEGGGVPGLELPEGSISAAYRA